MTKAELIDKIAAAACLPARQAGVQQALSRACNCSMRILVSFARSHIMLDLSLQLR